MNVVAEEIIRTTMVLCEHLRQLLEQVPPGRVTTYGALATTLGDSIASRWVGKWMLQHDHDEACPCHRVVRADGTLGFYIEGNPEKKAQRLQEEKVEIPADRIDLATYAFSHFHGDRPLRCLSKFQDEISQAVQVSSFTQDVQYIGGVDVSYVSETEGVATYCRTNRTETDSNDTTTISGATRFPYISSYLAFRELPLLLELVHLIRGQGALADILFVDGSGVLHPRRSGIASMLGVAAQIPTIGITKKRLCGQLVDTLSYEKPARIEVHGELLGTAILPNRKTDRPIYVSPGHLCSVESAAELVLEMRDGYRLPRPPFDKQIR